ncbi:glycosyltransferase family 9 protein [bacterium]|nr:MAG: glycosyltransferase family 9 protein [bacterium]
MSLHEVDRILALLGGLGEKAAQSDRVLHCGATRKEREEIGVLLAANGVGEGEKLAGIAPGSVWATKRWTPEGFAEVGEKLSKSGFRVLLVGGPEDRALCEEIASKIGGNSLSIAGKSSLKALSALMERLSLFIVNDSAPLHVAMAKKVPTVAIFGATVRELGFYPLNENSRVVEVGLDCRPCGLHGGNSCPRGHFRCMKDITPRMVLDACGELLEDR